jgi:hypothetical protein
MREEAHELHERAEQGHHDPALAPVSLTMAILAVLVAAVSLLGHRAHTEELLRQSKATDQWAYYQAKNIRRHTYQLFLDILSIREVKNSQRSEAVKGKYQHELERYQEEQKEIEAGARKLEKETDLQRRKADRFDLGEVFLEVALVITSITLLTRRRLYWRLGMLLGLVGLVVASTSLLLR